MGLIILGRGGFSAEVEDYVLDVRAHDPHALPALAGFADMDRDTGELTLFPSRTATAGEPSWLQPDDTVLLAVGTVPLRRAFMGHIQAAGATPATLIHPQAYVSRSASIAPGTIICPFATAGPNTVVGPYTMLYLYCLLAHDVVLGSNNVFSPNTMVTGEVVIGSDNFFGVASTINPRLTIGSHCQIQSGVTVHTSLPDHTFCHGPGRAVLVDRSPSLPL